MVVRYLGAMFLLYLGVKIIIGALRKRSGDQPAEAVKQENYFLRALLGVTNPKAILFYVSFFIQFIDPRVTHTAPAFATGALIQVISFSYYSLLLVAGAVMVRYLQPHPPGQAGEHADRHVFWLRRAVGQRAKLTLLTHATAATPPPPAAP